MWEQSIWILDYRGLRDMYTKMAHEVDTFLPF